MKNKVVTTSQEIESKYLENKSKYYIEQTLLNSLSIKELQDFIENKTKELK